MVALVALIVLARQSTLQSTQVEDAVLPAKVSEVTLGGLLGQRYAASEHARLPSVDEDELLAGFRHHPGRQAWIGEHVGKWLHAASLTYESHHDRALRAKLDRVANGLMATQEGDGYMGTYLFGQRFGLATDADWDVWVHKYCMIGLLAYYHATKNPKAIESVKKIADLLDRTFAPGRKLLSQAGTHMGMASTSVLEPVVLLYKETQNPRYLAFAKRIVESYNEPGGSHLERDLLTTGSVAKSANGKAYEMLSNLVGLAELYRATGESRYLRPTLVAWNDIVKNRLYITGTGSSHEHWTQDGNKPDRDGDNVGETCVTVTWIQLNNELYRITGDARFVDEIERSVYNHLLGSQREDGAAWCYYSPLDGVRHPGMETNCCLSSGPRGIALIPSIAYGKRIDGIDVNLFGSSTYSGSIRISQSTQFPEDGKIQLLVERGNSRPVTLRLRVPAWTSQPNILVNGKHVQADTSKGYLSLRRTWRKGDLVSFRLPMPLQTFKGSGNKAGFVAYSCGPLVYAANYTASGVSASEKISVGQAVPKRKDSQSLTLEAESFPAGGFGRHKVKLVLLPYFLAGKNQSRYSVWLNTQVNQMGKLDSFVGAKEMQSRLGNVGDSIADGDSSTTSNTFNNSRAAEDWYAVEISQPILISRIVFRHGQSFHDGGWFDTSQGNPRIEILRSPKGKWEPFGVLKSYPKTSAISNGGLTNGASFEMKFEPILVSGIRIIGVPSHGDNPQQNFSSCSELGGFKQ